MEELRSYIKARIIDTRFDSLSRNKDGEINQIELDWYVDLCLQKLVDLGIRKVFDE